MLFPKIRVGDGSIQSATFRTSGTILLNPPFGVIAGAKDCAWAGGRVSAAAVFVTTTLEQVRPGTEVLAILPEVLRSGTFSRRWRMRVGELARVELIEPYGIFDDSADIDVFILRLIRRNKREDVEKK